MEKIKFTFADTEETVEFLCWNRPESAGSAISW